MQVWPAFSSLPMAIFSAAPFRSVHEASMMQGDLPPSSSVTGVRLRAAASATCRPTAVEPVKNRWSKGSSENARATSTPPVTTANSSGANCPATSLASSCAVCGVNSLGLSSTRLPAASAVALGPKASCNG